MRGLLLAMELRRWRAAGRKPVLWWRDDDARDDAPALRRLLALAAATGLPLTLAAIPDGDRSGLGRALAQAVYWGAATVGAARQGLSRARERRRARRAARKAPGIGTA